LKSKESLESYVTVPSIDSLKTSNISIESKLSDESYQKNARSSIDYKIVDTIMGESNELKIDSKDSKLPKISVDLLDQKIEINGSCTFMIEFNAYDDNYQIIWIHNKKILKQKAGNEKITIKNEINRSYLRIVNVQIEDSGVYECVVQTRYGMVKSCAKLSIIYGKYINIR
jgi:citrate lyase gamma subunit